MRLNNYMKYNCGKIIDEAVILPTKKIIKDAKLLSTSNNLLDSLNKLFDNIVFSFDSNNMEIMGDLYYRENIKENNLINNMEIRIFIPIEFKYLYQNKEVLENVLLPRLYRVIEHEKIHLEQRKRKWKNWKGTKEEFISSLKKINSKIKSDSDYFSKKEEIMAFAYNIAKESNKNNFQNHSLYKLYLKHTSNKIIKKLKKYILEYISKELTENSNYIFVDLIYKTTIIN